MNELLTLKIRLQSDMMTTVRLTTGGVCSLAGLDLDESEDCKVCVTESLLLLLHRGYRAASLSFRAEEGLKIRVEGEEAGEIGEESVEDEISAALLGALAEDVTTEKEGDCLRAIGFRFGNGR